ncbi:MAG: magnesium transporter MgtE N-terminal domain-containing protein [Pyrinomonadaceae bacterium]
MAMLSELLKFDVVDAKGRSARVSDFALEILGDDYPPVTALYFSEGKEQRRIDWKDVTEIDKAARQFKVKDLKDGAADSHDERAGEVLLKRDILDALIIDLLQRGTTRSADLLLSTADGEMRLRAADAGLSAMLRRITRGLFKGARKRNMFDWKYVEFLRGDPRAVESGAGYNMRIGRLPAGEIAQIADYLPYLHAAELLTLINDDKAALVLQAMSIERQLQVIEEFDEEQAINLLTLMSPDRSTDLIGRLHPETMKRYLSRVPKKQRERIIDLLRYPEDSVGGVMINNFLTLGERTTVRSAQEQVRSHSKERDFISVVFITESKDKKVLTGAVTIRHLLDADDEDKLKDVMDPYLVTLNPFDPAIDAAYRVIAGQIAAMAVTDPEGELIGAMTIDSAISQIVSPGSGLSSIKVFS